ncbi:hypothetical protein EV363DRAFT_1157791, partial [Boletus edulis]
LSGTPWAKLIFKFFDDALFPDSSNSAPSSSRLAANIDDDLDWEAAFERAFADGGPSPQGQAPGPAPASAATPPTTVDNLAQSISAPIVPNIAIAAIAAPVINNSVSAPFNPATAAIPAPDAALASRTFFAPAVCPAVAPSVEDDVNVNLLVDQARPQTKAKGGAAKSKRNGKAVAKGLGNHVVNEDDIGGDAPTSATVARRSGRNK